MCSDSDGLNEKVGLDISDSQYHISTALLSSIRLSHEAVAEPTSQYNTVQQSFRSVRVMFAGS
jgi:hypothetical protein